MADAQTSNIGLFIPARGNDTGTWDTPVNANSTLLDLIVGGTATIGLNNSNIILSAAQFQAGRIVFNSTLTGSITATFPTSFTKSYTILNQCTGSSQFTITLETTSPGQVINCPPGQSFECWNDGTNISFHNFGPPVGGYWDYGGSSNPTWNSCCTVPPYLPCDGTTTISSITYPVLFAIAGSSVLPDFRGRVPGYLDAGAGRISSGSGGVAGNTLYAAGGSQTTTLSSQNIPPVKITDPGHTHDLNGSATIQLLFNGGSQLGAAAGGGNTTNVSVTSAVTGISAGNASPTAVQTLPPIAMGGIRMIRAA